MDIFFSIYWQLKIFYTYIHRVTTNFDYITALDASLIRTFSLMFILNL